MSDGPKIDPLRSQAVQAAILGADAEAAHQAVLDAAQAAADRPTVTGEFIKPTRVEHTLNREGHRHDAEIFRLLGEPRMSQEFVTLYDFEHGTQLLESWQVLREGFSPVAPSVVVEEMARISNEADAASRWYGKTSGHRQYLTGLVSGLGEAVHDVLDTEGAIALFPKPKLVRLLAGAQADLQLVCYGLRGKDMPKTGMDWHLGRVIGLKRAMGKINSVPVATGYAAHMQR